MLENRAIIEKFNNETVEEYKKKIKKKKIQLLMKRLFDIIFSLILILILLPIFIILGIVIKIDSKGTVFYRQIRVTKNGKLFKIFKFRTMISDADKKGTLVTVENDNRITRVGKLIRKVRIDELPQIFNIFLGTMSFVGPRPEVEKYVLEYTDEMMATLLLPAGVTSLASIKFKDEDELLKDVLNVDDFYINEVLPKKMKFNIEYLNTFSLFYDIKISLQTIFNILIRG